MRGPGNSPPGPKALPPGSQVFDSTGEETTRQARFDLPKRTATLTRFPAAPPVPLEHAPTILAPPQLPPKATLRAPTPVDAITITDAPGAEPDAPTLPPPSASADEAAKAALRRRAEAAEAKAAELERQARVRAEASVASYPPPVSDRPKPAAVTQEPEGQAVIGWLLATATRNAKAIRALVAAFGIAGGVGAVKVATDDRPSSEAFQEALRKAETEHGVTRSLVKGLIDREARRDAYEACREELYTEAFRSLLPAHDRVGNATPIKPWVDRCSRLKPP